MKIKTKNAKKKTKKKKWRYVYRTFGITQRFNIEDTKGRSQIRMIAIKNVTHGETL